MNRPMGVPGYCLLFLVCFEMVAFKSQPPLAGIVHVYSKKRKRNKETTTGKNNTQFLVQNTELRDDRGCHNIRVSLRLLKWSDLT